MNLASRQTDAGPANTRLQLICWFLVAYLSATAPAMIAYTRATGSIAPIMLHLMALILCAAASAPRIPLPRAVRDCIPLLIGPFLYLELRWLIPGVGAVHADWMVLRWEATLFPSHPSSTLALRFPVRWMSELLHAAYLSYYAIVLLPPAQLYLNGRRREYAETVMILLVTYAICFITFLLFPVDGPRYALGPAAAPDGPIRSLVLSILQGGSSRGTAFPSSHVAASFAATVAALRYQPRVGYPVALLTTLLTIATVYGGFHYGVDAVAGIVTGVLSAVATDTALVMLSRRTSATLPT